jgi:hypothetical protein
MRGVWAYLRRSNVVPNLDALKPHETLAYWEIEGTFSDRERACAALVSFTVIEFSSVHRAITRAEAIAWSKDWEAAARLCRWMHLDPMFPMFGGRIPAHTKYDIQLLSWPSSWISTPGNSEPQDASPISVKTTRRISLSGAPARGVTTSSA